MKLRTEKFLSAPNSVPTITLRALYCSFGTCLRFSGYIRLIFRNTQLLGQHDNRGMQLKYFRLVSFLFAGDQDSPAIVHQPVENVITFISG